VLHRSDLCAGIEGGELPGRRHSSRGAGHGRIEGQGAEHAGRGSIEAAWVNSYGSLAAYTLALERFDETRQIIREAQARKLDTDVLHNALYALAFVGSNSAAMAEQQQWYAGKPDYANLSHVF
jgi:hypothetical protein